MMVHGEFCVNAATALVLVMIRKFVSYVPPSNDVLAFPVFTVACVHVASSTTSAEVQLGV